MIVKIGGLKHYVAGLEVNENKITKLYVREIKRNYAPIVNLTGKPLEIILMTLSDEDIKDLIDSYI